VISDVVSGLATEFNDIGVFCGRFCYLTRDSSFQKEGIAKASEFYNKLDAHKRQAKVERDEDSTNAILCLECMAVGVEHELRMWLKLKDKEYDQGWNELITAQQALEAAIRAHEIGGKMRLILHRLVGLERLLFPPHVFSSAGFIVRSAKCSICGGEYDDCDHIAGRVYWGEFCSMVVERADLKEISIVDNPADKRCRTTSVQIDGTMRNLMTWKPSEGDASPQSACEMRANRLNLQVY